MLKINKILSKKIKLPLSLRGMFPFCHSRESGNPSPMSLRGAKQRSNLSGFSLIELMVAVAIFAMAIFGIFQAYSVGFMGMVDARNVTVATNYAREKMEEIKNNSFVEITDESGDIIGTKFEREVNVVSIEDDGTVGKEVTTTVIWYDRNNVKKEVKLDTLIYDY